MKVDLQGLTKKIAEALTGPRRDVLIYSVFEMAAHIEACERRLEAAGLEVPGIEDRDEMWDHLADTFTGETAP